MATMISRPMALSFNTFAHARRQLLKDAPEALAPTQHDGRPRATDGPVPSAQKSPPRPWTISDMSHAQTLYGRDAPNDARSHKNKALVLQALDVPTASGDTILQTQRRGGGEPLPLVPKGVGPTPLESKGNAAGVRPDDALKAKWFVPTQLSGRWQTSDSDAVNINGAEHGIALKVFIDPETQEREYVADIDNRAPSSSKYRSVAISSSGRFSCCLVIKTAEEKYAWAKDGSQEAFLTNKAQSLCDEVMREVRMALAFSPDAEVYRVGQTEDGRLLVFMRDYPEESSYLFNAISESNFAGAMYKLFDDVTRINHGLHEKGVVFGDNKPANWMRMREGGFTLIDWEAANYLDASGRADISGTTFLPPENECEKSGLTPWGRRIGPTLDVWAIGLSLVQLVAARDPRLRIKDIESFVFDLRKNIAAFSRFRVRVFAQGFAAHKIDANDRFGRMFHLFAQIAPDLCEHTLDQLLAPRDILRPSLAPSRLLAQRLLRQHASAIAQADEEIATLLKDSFSSKREPAMRALLGELPAAAST